MSVCTDYMSNAAVHLLQPVAGRYGHTGIFVPPHLTVVVTVLTTLREDTEAVLVLHQSKAWPEQCCVRIY